MSIIIAVIIELAVSLCAMWVLTFLSTLLHELGHALGYMLATGDRHWHIRVGWGKRLLNTKALTVNLLVFDGFFTPSEKKINTRAKLIATLSPSAAAADRGDPSEPASAAQDVRPRRALRTDDQHRAGGTAAAAFGAAAAGRL